MVDFDNLGQTGPRARIHDGRYRAYWFDGTLRGNHLGVNRDHPLVCG
jgi:hypothetical protein